MEVRVLASDYVSLPLKYWVLYPGEYRDGEYRLGPSDKSLQPSPRDYFKLWVKPRTYVQTHLVASLPLSELKSRLGAGARDVVQLHKVEVYAMQDVRDAYAVVSVNHLRLFQGGKPRVTPEGKVEPGGAMKLVDSDLKATDHIPYKNEFVFETPTTLFEDLHFFISNTSARQPAFFWATPEVNLYFMVRLLVGKVGRVVTEPTTITIRGSVTGPPFVVKQLSGPGVEELLFWARPVENLEKLYCNLKVKANTFYEGGEFIFKFNGVEMAELRWGWFEDVWKESGYRNLLPHARDENTIRFEATTTGAIVWGTFDYVLEITLAPIPGKSVEWGWEPRKKPPVDVKTVALVGGAVFGAVAGGIIAGRRLAKK